MKKIYYVVMAFLTCSLSVQSQHIEDDLFDLSLEELMNIEIVSASKESESLFESPVSSCVITGNEIMLNGATSIPEALKNCPGLLVREVANGTYDVSVRGGVDGLPSYNYTTLNSSILVMIDGRPVFNNFQGGTYWQNLPVALADIKQIEVVYGPMSSLYGPNAVSGVINIITKTPDADGVQVSASLQEGAKAHIFSVLTNYRANEKLAVGFSANYDQRIRHEIDYYDKSQQSFVSSLMDITDQHFFDDQAVLYPNEKNSLRKSSARASIYYTPKEDINFTLEGGINDNAGLMPFSYGLPISTFTNNSNYVYLSSTIHDLSFQVSALDGVQGLTGNQINNKYNYRNTDLYIDYKLKVGDKISIRPAISYQASYVNDKEYTTERGELGTFNGEGEIKNYAGSIKLDYKPIDKLRVILAGRMDSFTHPDDNYLSYQGILNYSLNDQNNVRLVTGKSNSGSFLANTLVHIETPLGPGMLMRQQGNKNLKLMQNTMYELGYRAKLSESLQLDFAVFNQKYENFNYLIWQNMLMEGADFVLDFQNQNLPLEANQTGFSVFLLSSFASDKVQLKVHGTYQKTELTDYSPYYKDPAVDPVNNTENLSDIESEGTPGFWGGFNLMATVTPKLKLNLSGYYFGEHKLTSLEQIDYNTFDPVDHDISTIAAKGTLNLTANYQLVNNVHVFVNMRNVLNNDSRENFGSEQIGGLYLFGINLTL